MTPIKCPNCQATLTKKEILRLYGQLMVSRRKTNTAGPGRGHKKMIESSAPSASKSSR